MITLQSQRNIQEVVFGPHDSRRFGKSLGVNPVPKGTRFWASTVNAMQKALAHDKTTVLRAFSRGAAAGSSHDRNFPIESLCLFVAEKRSATESLCRFVKFRTAWS